MQNKAAKCMYYLRVTNLQYQKTINTFFKKLNDITKKQMFLTSVNIIYIQTCKKFLRVYLSQTDNYQETNLNGLRKCSVKWHFSPYFTHYNKKRRCMQVI